MTVTAVDTSPDLRSARVYVSVLGDEAEREATLDALNARTRRPPVGDRARDADQVHADADIHLRRRPGAQRPTLAACSTSERRGGRVASDLDQVVEALRANDSFLLTTHEGPDGDALGSLLAMQGILEQLGKDSVMFLSAKEFPLPVEYRFMPLTDVFHEPPADVVDRVLVFLDCGNIDRMPVDFLRRDGAQVLNIDHHHDNTRFGTVNLVDTEASCTAQIVYEISKRLGVDADAGARLRALRRAGDRHRQVHVREHRRRRASDGGRADRGRGRRRRHLPAPLRAGPDREAPADRSGAGEDRALRRRPASPSPTSTPATTRRPARARC